MKLNIKEHLKAISPSIILLLGYGTQLVWALNEYQTNHQLHRSEMKFVTYYFGGLFGAVFGAGLISVVQKSVIYNIAAFFTLIVGVLFAASGLATTLLIFGRFVAGTCHSMTLLTALIHASEIASHENVRHKVITVLGICVGLSVALSAAIFTLPVNAEIIVGVMCLIQAVSAFLTNIYNTKESPYFLQQKPNTDLEEASNEAFETFILFHDELTSNDEITIRFSLLKSYVIEEKNVSKNIFNSKNFIALLLCTPISLLSRLIFNFQSINYIIFLQNSLLESDKFGIVSFGLLYFTCGLIVALVFYKSRHILFLIGTVFIFAMVYLFYSVLVAAPSGALQFMITRYLFWVPLLNVFCLSLPLEIYAIINLSEAFSLSKKAFSISFILIIESSFHLLICWLGIVNNVVGLISIGIAFTSFIVYFHIPRNTNNLMLEKCPDAYKAARAVTDDDHSFISLSE